MTSGFAHSCAILSNDQLKCWGSNSSGQLGLGDTLSRGGDTSEMGGSLPSIDLGTGRTAVFIDAGVNFTCALLDNATVKCWGVNFFGQFPLEMGHFLSGTMRSIGSGDR